MDAKRISGYVRLFVETQPNERQATAFHVGSLHVYQ